VESNARTSYHEPVFTYKRNYAESNNMAVVNVERMLASVEMAVALQETALLWRA
jgi:hypothetical protein